jgi:hypothetical protein
LNDAWYIFVVIRGVEDNAGPRWGKYAWYAVEGVISVTIAINVLGTLASLKRVINLNPAVRVPNAILITNTIVVIALVVFNFQTSDPNITFMDVGNNVVALVIQILLIGFCWQSSLQPKKKEEADPDAPPPLPDEMEENISPLLARSTNGSKHNSLNSSNDEEKQKREEAANVAAQETRRRWLDDVLAANSYGFSAVIVNQF